MHHFGVSTKPDRKTENVWDMDTLTRITYRVTGNCFKQYTIVWLVFTEPIEHRPNLTAWVPLKETVSEYAHFEKPTTVGLDNISTGIGPRRTRNDDGSESTSDTNGCNGQEGL